MLSTCCLAEYNRQFKSCSCILYMKVEYISISNIIRLNADRYGFIMNHIQTAELNKCTLENFFQMMLHTQRSVWQGAESLVGRTIADEFEFHGN